MKLPEGIEVETGFPEEGSIQWALRLMKVLYGLKQGVFQCFTALVLPPTMQSLFL
jgi:hypothetical protein